MVTVSSWWPATFSGVILSPTTLKLNVRFWAGVLAPQAAAPRTAMLTTAARDVPTEFIQLLLALVAVASEWAERLGGSRALSAASNPAASQQPLRSGARPLGENDT